MKSISVLFAVVMLLMSGRVLATGDISEIINYREYSPQFSSSGQPTAEQLEAGFKRVMH